LVTANTVDADGNPLISGQTMQAPRLACDSDNILYFFLSVFAKKTFENFVPALCIFSCYEQLPQLQLSSPWIGVQAQQDPQVRWWRKRRYAILYPIYL
jgi:hypothetical protein